MHELSIAMALVEIAIEECERIGGRVEAVHVRVGQLSGVVTEALVSSYEMASFDTPLQGSRLVIEDVPGAAYCASCGVERQVTRDQWFSCGECGNPMPEVRRGKELELVALEMDQ